MTVVDQHLTSLPWVRTGQGHPLAGRPQPRCCHAGKGDRASKGLLLLRMKSRAPFVGQCSIRLSPKRDAPCYPESQDNRWCLFSRGSSTKVQTRWPSSLAWMTSPGASGTLKDATASGPHHLDPQLSAARKSRKTSTSPTPGRWWWKISLSLLEASLESALTTEATSAWSLPAVSFLKTGGQSRLLVLPSRGLFSGGWKNSPERFSRDSNGPASDGERRPLWWSAASSAGLHLHSAPYSWSDATAKVLMESADPSHGLPPHPVATTGTAPPN